MEASDREYRASAHAHANIAIAKYWGKRDEALNLPLFDSVSFNVEGLQTETSAEWNDDDIHDALFIDGWQVPFTAMGRISRMIDAVRSKKGWNKRCVVSSKNNFAQSSGLASSASGCAAAAAAIAKAADISYSEAELSALARLGSGSAARSVPSGWTRWHAGSNPDGSDSFATQIASHNYWPLQVFVVQISDAPKAVSSTECMKLSQSSPYWNTFAAEAAKAADAAQFAIIQRDFHALASAMHHNALMLQSLVMTTDRPVIYFEPQGLALFKRIMRMSQGMPVCCTMDAGANIVILCEDVAYPFVKNDIIAAGLSYIQTRIGGGVHCV